MDSGFNMLGQFQGDSSLGLGSFQGNSQPSTRALTLRPVGFFSDVDDMNKKLGERRMRMMKDYLEWFQIQEAFDEDEFETTQDNPSSSSYVSHPIFYSYHPHH
jgi:hypothetical protein